jgi:uncharacterized damage-inducible protein DinB
VTHTPASPTDQLRETWQIHNRIHLFLLDALPADALHGSLSSGGRDIGQQFAHVHNVRLMWLKPAAPALLDGLVKLEADGAHDKALLAESLSASSRAIETLIVQGLEAGRIKSFKPHPVAFVGYMIAHESSHRGEIGVALTQSGYRLPDKIAYGLWEWGSR